MVEMNEETRREIEAQAWGQIQDQVVELFGIVKLNTEAIENLVKALEAGNHAMGEAAGALQVVDHGMEKNRDAVAEVRIFMANTAEILMAADTALEAQIKTSNTRRRINRSISVKGIVQYEGTVEGHGLTHEEMMVEQAKMDAEIDRLQPKYEEFVVALPTK